jgi:hypothetical protein
LIVSKYADYNYSNNVFDLAWQLGSGTPRSTAPSPMYLQFRVDGSGNVTVWFGLDATNFVQFGSSTTLSDYIGAVTHVGFGFAYSGCRWLYAAIG